MRGVAWVIMGPLAMHRRLRRLRRGLAVVVLMLALGGAVTFHHGAPVQMPGGHHGMDMGTVIELCLGAFSAVGAAIVAIAVGVLALGRWRPLPMSVAAGVLFAPHPPAPQARAGPAFLCVFRR